MDGLRALAALFVVGCHCLPFVWAGSAPSNLFFKLLSKLQDAGHFAVGTFIVVSGFCLMLPTLRDNLTVKGGFARFLPRRFLRIAPPLYIATLMSLVILPFSVNWDADFTRMQTVQLFPLSAGLNLRVLGGTLLMIQHLTGPIPNNGALWSVSVEWWIYFTFIPFLWVWRRLGGVFACAGVVVVAFALSFVHEHVYSIPRFIDYYQFVGLFVLGAAAAYIANAKDASLERIRNHPFWLTAGIIFALILAAVITKKGWPWALHNLSLLDVCVGVAVPSLLIACQQQRHIWLRRLLGARPLVFIGAFSYSLYLIHLPLVPFLFLNFRHRYPDLSQNIYFLAAVVWGGMTLILAYAFYRIAELPFHALARNYGKARMATKN